MSADHLATWMREGDASLCDAASRPAPKHCWRIVYVAPGAERKVVAAMIERGLTAYYPIEKIWRGFAIRRRVHERPLIHRYVFVHIEDRVIPTVAHLEGVNHFVGDADDGIRVFVDELKQEEIAGLYDHTARSSVPLKEGQNVQITRGAFKGVAAKIVSLSKGGRAKLMTNMFGRSGAMEVDVDSLEAA